MAFRILKVNDVQNAPEIIIYFLIEGLGDFIHCIHRARTRPSGGDAGLFTQKVQDDVENARADQIALVEILKQREELAFKDHEEYMQWYRWWNRWHKRDLTDEQWNALDRLLKWEGWQTEETFSEWRPQGDWRSSTVTA